MSVAMITLLVLLFFFNRLATVPLLLVVALPAALPLAAEGVARVLRQREQHVSSSALR
jgi:hypothetical protein